MEDTVMPDHVRRPTRPRPSRQRRPGMGRAVRTLSVLTLAASCLAACGGQTGGKITANSTIVISFSQLVPDNLPLWIAQDRGIFKKDGLKVELKYVTGQTGLQTLLSGDTQLAAIGAAEGVS